MIRCTVWLIHFDGSKTLDAIFEGPERQARRGAENWMATPGFWFELVIEPVQHAWHEAA